MSYVHIDFPRGVCYGASVMKQMVRPDWFYAFYFTPPVLSAGVVART